MKQKIIYGISFFLILVAICSVSFYVIKGYNDKASALDKVAVTMNYDGFADEEEYKEIVSELYVSQDVSEKYKNVIKINLSVENNSEETVYLMLNTLNNEYFYVYESFIRLEPWMPIAAHSTENTEMYILTKLSKEDANAMEQLQNNPFSFNVFNKDINNWENFVSKDIDCNVTVD